MSSRSCQPKHTPSYFEGIVVRVNLAAATSSRYQVKFWRTIGMGAGVGLEWLYFLFIVFL